MMQRTQKFRQALIYPVTLVFSLSLFWYLKALDTPLWISTYLPITVGALFIHFLERIFPYQKEWTPDINEVRQDAYYLVLVQMLLPIFTNFFFTISLVNLIASSQLTIDSIWPHHWNPILQCLLMLTFADLLRYWLHRASHTNSFLWRLHAVHHSPEKLYWLNVARFHPAEKVIQYTLDTLPFIILGVAPDVFALYYVLYAINGFFQHCNIKLEMVFLNKIISTAQLHRWHHSDKIKESNSNYGNNIIIWDILFGTYYFPQNKHVDSLGLINKEYPQSFMKQLWTPLYKGLDKRPIQQNDIKNFVLNLLLSFKMKWIYYSLVRPLYKDSKHPNKVQKKLLQDILRNNASSQYGKKYQFSRITNIREYQKNIPISEYDQIKDFIQNQEQTHSVICSKAFMYNQTSGTTGEPKYIPITKESITDLKHAQQISAWHNYNSCPEAYQGKLLGIVSPAIEGHLDSGTPYGAASGHIYNTMPDIARKKYVLPSELFSIENYTHKYYILTRIALEEESITFMGTANPSTFHKIEETIKTNVDSLIKDLNNGTCKYLGELEPSLRTQIEKFIKTNKQRAASLLQLQQQGSISLSSLWPHLKLITTWTKGSCGIALSSLLQNQNHHIDVCELGYLASEMRGSIVIDPKNGTEILNTQSVFFEFCERDKWEQGETKLLTLNEIEKNLEYYIFITTKTGLYRYNMNDIIKVTGYYNNTPTIQFQQKGKGVTNITGEKLYESQILSAMQEIEQELSLDFNFYQAVADEEAQQYIIYVEPQKEKSISSETLSILLDQTIQKLNIEYMNKRKSGRLKPIEVKLLKQGTYETFKETRLKDGVREGQFKTVILEYKKNSTFPWSQYAY